MGTKRCWSVTAVVLAVATAGCTHFVHWEDFEGALDEVNQSIEDHETRLGTLEGDVEELRGDVDALRQELDQLREDFDAHAADSVAHGMRLALPVHFDFDRAEIREVDRPILDRFAQAILNTYPQALITLEGFTDPAGSEAYNVRLGRQRAESVRQYLVEQHGMNAELIRTTTFGELRARQANPGARGPGQSGIENRRVSFVVEWAGRTGELGRLQGQRHGN